MNELTPFQALQKKELFEEFVKQLRKDFEGAGEALQEQTVIPQEYNELLGFLVPVIKQVDRNGHLHGLLYRIDVSEQQIKKACLQMPEKDFEDVLADLIIRRILQKIVLRKKFSA
jgi:flagellar biosynthesis component FlhA